MRNQTPTPEGGLSDECHAFIQHIPGSAGCLVLDDALTLLCANRHFYQTIGEEISSLQACYADRLDEFSAVRQEVIAAYEAGLSEFSVDCRLATGEQTDLWLRMNGSFREASADGQSVCLVILTDISDLVADRDEQSRYFQWMMDEYRGNIYISDMDTYELLYLNAPCCETLKSPREKLVGKLCYEVIQGLSEPCPFCTNQHLSPDKNLEWEHYNPLLNCTWMLKDRIINWNGHPVRIELGYDMYSTEYKLAKKDREREVLLRSIPGGFVRVDARDYNTVLWYGSEFLDLIGYTAEQFQEELHSTCGYVHPEDLDRITATLRELHATGESKVAEGRIITRSGEVRTLTLTLCYASGEDSWDGIPSFYSIGVDVTKEREEEARQQKALEDAYLAARMANAAKTDFLSTMSHDIRTPMNAIIGMTDIAQANLASPDKLQDCLKKIKVSGSHLLNLINEVLDMSTIESGRIDLVTGVVSLPDLIQNVSDMCRPLLEEKRQQFHIQMDQLIHEKVITDGERLQQAFLNLLSNAIKYTPEDGEIRWQIQEQPASSSQKGLFTFVFADNGIGISDEFIPHIFDPFSRAEDSRISKIQGTGLGMTITENIIRMMNGSIDVKSRLGKGSTFTVSVEFDLPSEQQCLDSQQKAAAEAEEAASLFGKRILLVEDNELNREIARELLQMQGAIIETAEHGQEAVDTYASTEPGYYDAILMDIQMPVMNGYDATVAIRQMGRADSTTIPIIALTANAFTSDVGKAHSVGMNDHASKPLDIGRLTQILSKWF